MTIEDYRRNIMDMIGKISSERRFRRIFWIVHNLFINDRQVH